MSKPIARRTVLKSALAVAALRPGLSVLAQAPPALPDHMRVLNIGGANVLACRTAMGLVLVDTGPAEADLSGPLLEFSTDTRFTIFNTHWHADQVGNNAMFGRLAPAGDAMSAMIVAHEKTKLRLSTRLYDPQTDSYTRPLAADARPRLTFHDTGSRTLGAENIDYGYLQLAHTDGDIYVHFRDSNVIAVGDVASPERDPALDWYGGGWIGGRVDAMDLLLSLANDATVIVPAYGPLMTKAQMQAERDMMAFLYDKLVDQVRMGFTPEDSLASGVMDGLVRSFQDPQKFLYDAHKGLWAHHNKLAPNIV